MSAQVNRQSMGTFGSPLAQASWVPAFQSFPPKPNAYRLKLASKTAHGEEIAGRTRFKRETRVSVLSMVGRFGRVVVGKETVCGSVRETGKLHTGLATCSLFLVRGNSALGTRESRLEAGTLALCEEIYESPEADAMGHKHLLARRMVAWKDETKVAQTQKLMDGSRLSKKLGLLVSLILRQRRGTFATTTDAT